MRQGIERGTTGSGAGTSGGVRLAFIALVLAMLPAVLDQTILATGLPTIASDLGHLSDVSWLVSVYVVAATATTPLWGKLGDRHGHKRLLQIALTTFVGASALCGLAQDMTQLIFLRGLQGVAAGGLMTLAMAAVGDLVSPRERGRYQGYIAATFAAATAIGPLLGGLVVDHASWRWVFYINVPVGAVALVALSTRLSAPATDRPQQPLDVVGAALLSGATTALLLTCLWGGSRYPWASAPIVALVGALVVLSGALVLRERRAADPIVPLRLLGTPVIAVASAALFLATVSLFAVTVFVPVFLQAATGASPTSAGLLLVPMMVGVTVSTTLAGRSIARTGRYKRFPIAGLALMTAALALLGGVAQQRSVVATGLGLAVFGLGFGMVTQVLIVAVQNAVDRQRLGIATATTAFFRALGGAVSAAVLGAVFAAGAGTSAQGGTLHTLDAVARTHITNAVQTVFLVAAPLAAIAMIVVLWLPEHPLQTRVAPQAPPPVPASGESPPGSDARQPAVRAAAAQTHAAPISEEVPSR
jgi:EmrB/QacA subfamily drug resistance transporter